MGKIGMNISSVRKHKEEETLAIVEKIAKIGYEGIEFIRYTYPPAKELRKALDDNHIVSAGSHIPYDSLLHDLDAALAHSIAIGSPYIILAHLPEPMKNIEGIALAGKALLPAAEKIKKSGLRFLYHHHDWELLDHNGKTGMDVLAEIIPEDLLGFEMETFWLEYCGLDQIAFMNKYRSRCITIHITDKKNHVDNDFTELGKGVIDLKSIVETGEKFGVEWYIVEQETYPGDMFDSLKEDCDYLKKLLKK
jgi:sugar phosphate isomerase/epimerase